MAALAAVFGVAVPAAAQPGATTGAVAPQECLVAEVIAQDCGPELLGLRIAITDGADATECGNLGDAGLGAFENICRWSNLASAWVTDDVFSAPGGGGGDDVSIDGVSATDPDFRSEGDIDVIRCTAASIPDASCVALEDVIFRITDFSGAGDLNSAGDVNDHSHAHLFSNLVGSTLNAGTYLAGNGAAIATSGTGTITATDLEADAVDDLGEIAAALKTGIDGKVVTGTPAVGECGQYDANGDLVGAGAACAAGLGVDLSSIDNEIITAESGGRLRLYTSAGEANGIELDFSLPANERRIQVNPISGAGHPSMNEIYFSNISLVGNKSSKFNKDVTDGAGNFSPALDFLKDAYYFFDNNGPQTLNLPELASGVSKGVKFCIQKVDFDGLITISPFVTDFIEAYGTKLADAENLLSSGLIGDHICLTSRNNFDGWYTFNEGETLWKEETEPSPLVSPVQFLKTGFQITLRNPDISKDYLIALPPTPGTMLVLGCTAVGTGSPTVTINLCDGTDLGDDTCTTSIINGTLACDADGQETAAVNALDYAGRDTVSLVLIAEGGTTRTHLDIWLDVRRD